MDDVEGGIEGTSALSEVVVIVETTAVFFVDGDAVTGSPWVISNRNAPLKKRKIRKRKTFKSYEKKEGSGWGKKMPVSTHADGAQSPTGHNSHPPVERSKRQSKK